ncbi:putative transmembrane protein [Mycolicibacterium aurum]|uniref:Putative transmembrane protein n=1 Tax=Mycolicibacterium aurum TaxID=1791 RepID=A0A3S4VHN3_MYCAU|nr:putative transmembrane protein [Mycolicibacterium aurum]
MSGANDTVHEVVLRLKALWRLIIPHLYGEPGETRGARILRRVRIGIVVAACVVTLQSVLLVAGAWRNDRQIERHLGVAEATVLDAGQRRSTIEFVTPDRVTYRPELGVLYPSELENGMRIYVEYDTNNPDLVRVQHRNAALAIVPAGSIAVVGWLIAGVALGGTALIERRRLRREHATV